MSIGHDPDRETGRLEFKVDQIKIGQDVLGESVEALNYKVDELLTHRPGKWIMAMAFLMYGLLMGVLIGWIIRGG